jgi:O-antigen ligase
VSVGPRGMRAPAPGQDRPAAGGPNAVLVVAGGMGLALLMMVAFVALDYGFDQDPHRLFKIVAGAAALGAIVMKPTVGVLLIPIATPFLPWMPRIPVPGLNTLNLLVIGVFGTWAVGRVMQRRPLLRPGRLTWPIVALMVLAALSIARGAAIPSGFEYDARLAGMALFRAGMTFAIYFIAGGMAEGPRDRRRLLWAIVAGLLLEAVVTLALGRNGRGGRAIGTIGQSNDLGAFLALFTVVAAAMVSGVRGAWPKLVLAAAAVAGVAACVLSVSRGGLLALGLGLAFVALRGSRALLFVMIAGLALSPLWAPDYLKDRIFGTQQAIEGTDELELEGAAQLRVDTWRATWDVITDHPLDGVGFTGLAHVLPTVGEGMGIEVKDSAHNTFLRFQAEMGLFGLLVLVWILWRCWWLGLRVRRLAADPFDRQLGIALSAATLALAVACMTGDRFLNIMISGNFWLLAALCDAVLREHRERPA